jgi:predicted metal-dependent enzyme (double-stranded beta helix superfamily)
MNLDGEVGGVRPGAMDEVRRICRGWAATVGRCGCVEERMEFFRGALPALLARTELLAGVLEGIADGRPLPDLRLATVFENEYLLHQDPAGLFSLRLYLYGPGELTFVHDHLAWGVSGSARGPLEIVRFRRTDDGSDPGLARLESTERTTLQPGEIETTLPLERGIHRTGNPEAGITWMVSVYGPPARRSVMHRFDLETGRVTPLHPPRMHKRLLARQALQEIPGPAKSSA